MAYHVSVGQGLCGAGPGQPRPGAPRQQPHPASVPVPETKGFGAVPSAAVARQVAGFVELTVANTSGALGAVGA